MIWTCSTWLLQHVHIKEVKLMDQIYWGEQRKGAQHNAETIEGKCNTPGPWLLRFFRSDKNLHEPNPQH